MSVRQVIRKKPTQPKRYYKLIGIKIFGIVLGVLLLLLSVAYFSTLQFRKLNNELQTLAEYSIPITNIISRVNVQILKQELHGNRIFRFESEQEIPQEQITDELIDFKQRGRLIHAELEEAKVLSQRAVIISSKKTDQKKFNDYLATLEKIEAMYRLFYNNTLDGLIRLNDKQSIAIIKLDISLPDEKARLNQAINRLLNDLGEFTQQAANTAEKHERYLLSVYLLATGIAILLGLIFSYLTATRLTRAIRKLTISVGKIAEENYDTPIEQLTNDEVGKLSDSFNLMLNELKIKAEIETQFAQHIDSRMVDKIINDPDESRTGGKKEEMTVFFSNIEGFDLLLLNKSATEAIEQRNYYYNTMTKAVSKHQGVVDKFIGTTIMAFWGVPFVDASEHSKLACLAALYQVKSINASKHLIYTEKHRLHIGLATGSLVVGNIGSEASKSFTVMGDTVNTASRLKGVAKQYGVHIVISEQTKMQVQDNFETREIDLIRVVGKDEPIRIYELLGLRIDLDRQQAEFRDTFEQGLFAYRKQTWDVAEQYFRRCLLINSEDQPCKLFLQRIERLRSQTDKKDWDGVWQMINK